MRLVHPGDDGRERAVPFEDQLMHKPVRQFKVVQNFPGVMDFEITRRQGVKMDGNIFITDGGRGPLADVFHQGLAQFLRRAEELGAASQPDLGACV